jgi:beta-lactamase regulating signal transducer with metallopeptidase domain
MTSPAYPIPWTAALLAAKGAFLVAAAWVAVRIFRSSGPVVRQRIWFAALAGLLIIPLAMPLVPKISLPLMALSADAAAGSVQRPAATSTAYPVATNERPGDRWNWIVAVYLCGMSVSLFWMLIGHWGSARVRRRGRRLPPEENAGLLEGLEIRRATGPIRIVVSEVAVVPSVRGLFRPAVVLPVDFREWPAERLKSTLLHEAAHVRRGDIIARAVGAAACLIHWFNPLAWHALGRMIREQESASDLFAVGHGVRPSRYAEDLLTFAPVRGRKTEFGPAVLSGTGDLRYRLETILDPKRRDRRISRLSLWTTAAAALAGILSIASIVPWNDAGFYEGLRAEAAEFLSADVAPVHRDILAEKDDALYLNRLLAELETGRFNKMDFEAHLARLRVIESRSGPDRTVLGQSVRAAREAVLERYLPIVKEYSPVLDDLRKERQSPPGK